MIRGLKTFKIAFLGLILAFPLAGCVERGNVKSGTYAMLVPKSVRLALKRQNVELIIKKDGRVSFSGKIGNFQKVAKRYKVVFANDQAEMFKVLKKGISENGSMYFWLEFTENGNCVLYDTTNVSFFMWINAGEEMNKQKMTGVLTSEP